MKKRLLIVLIIIGLISAFIIGCFLLYNFLNIAYRLNDKLLYQTTSPDGNRQLSIFQSNGGATTDFGIDIFDTTETDYLHAPRIYHQYHQADVTVKWFDNDTVEISGYHTRNRETQTVTLNLELGETWDEIE